MSPSEKGYFKKFVYKGKSRNTAYITLFDSIERQSEFNEKKLIQDFNKHKHSTSFASARTYLYKILLRTLVEYHADSTPTDTLLRNIREMHVLLERGLHKACKRKLDSARRLAAELDNQSFDFALHQIELALATYSNRGTKELIEIIQRSREKLVKREAALEYQLCHARYVELALNYGFVAHTAKEANAFRELLASKLLQTPPEGLGFHAQFSFFSARAGLHQAVNEMEEALSYSEEILSLFDQYPKQKINKHKHFLQSVNTYLNQLLLCGEVRKFDLRVEQALNLISTLPESHVTKERKTYLLSLQLRRLIMERNFTEAKEFIPTLLADSVSFQNQPGNTLMLHYLIMLVHFYSRDWNHSLDLIQQIESNFDLSTNRTYYTWILIVRVLIQLELGNRDLLEYSRLSAYRHLMKQHPEYETERLMISFLGKLGRVPESEWGALFDELRTQIEACYESGWERTTIFYLDVLSWLDQHSGHR
jgi:hypothetical protein